MNLPKVKKHLTDLLPRSGALSGTAKHIGAGLLAITIGTFGVAGASTPPLVSPASTSSTKQVGQEQGTSFVLHQGTASPQLHAQHWSHSSHSSHSSHYSHYSSR